MAKNEGKYAAGETSTNQYFQGPTYWRAASRRATAIDVHHRILRRTGTNVSRDGARLPCRVTYSSFLGTEYGGRYRLLGARHILVRGPRVELGLLTCFGRQVGEYERRLSITSSISTQYTHLKKTKTSSPTRARHGILSSSSKCSRIHVSKRGGGAESDSEAPLYRPASSVFLCISETSVDCEA